MNKYLVSIIYKDAKEEKNSIYAVIVKAENENDAINNAMMRFQKVNNSKNTLIIIIDKKCIAQLDSNFDYNEFVSTLKEDTKSEGIEFKILEQD